MCKKVLLMITCVLLISVTPIMAQPVPDFCEGNFDCDDNVDGTDAFMFKSDFGRSTILNPCPSLDDCPSPWAPCPTGMLVCNNSCVDPQTDEINCGGCGIPCNRMCVAGECQQDMPDLVIQKMVMDPIQPTQGQTVAIEITVKNQGQNASGLCWLDWYSNLDTPPIPDQAGDQYIQIPVLPPSGTYTWQLSYIPSAAGDLNMYAFADSFSEMEESIDDNNVYGPYGYHVAEGCVGTPSPLGRWCDQNNGTVKDMTTGLVWLKDAGWGGQKPWEDCATHDDAHTRAGLLASGMGGLSDGSVEGDWRLPSQSELVSIIFGDESIRSSQMYFFTNVQPWFYWSSTTYTDDTFFASGVDMQYGSVGDNYKPVSYYVWPVRGGQ
jgi:hypothetical protein